MIDAKQVAKRVSERLSKHEWPERVQEIIADEIDKAQHPEPKTRGQEVAETLVRKCRGGATISGLLCDGKKSIYLFIPERFTNEFDGDCAVLRSIVSALVDSERWHAAQAERDECVRIADQVHKEYRSHGCLLGIARGAEMVANRIREGQPSTGSTP